MASTTPDLLWDKYGEGLRAKTPQGEYVVGPTRGGWWAYFHCGCCRSQQRVTLRDSDLRRVQKECLEHYQRLMKRYQEAGA